MEHGGEMPESEATLGNLGAYNADLAFMTVHTADGFRGKLCELRELTPCKRALPPTRCLSVDPSL